MGQHAAAGVGMLALAPYIASLRRQQRAPHADCVGAGTNRSRKPWWADNKHPLKSR